MHKILWKIWSRDQNIFQENHTWILDQKRTHIYHFRKKRDLKMPLSHYGLLSLLPHFCRKPPRFTFMMILTLITVINIWMLLWYRCLPSLTTNLSFNQKFSLCLGTPIWQNSKEGCIWCSLSSFLPEKKEPTWEEREGCTNRGGL